MMAVLVFRQNRQYDLAGFQADIMTQKHFFHLTGPLWGGFTRHLWIPHTKGQQCRAFGLFIPPPTKLAGYIGFTLSVCPSVRLSVGLLAFRVRPVASAVQDGLFPYLVQMINSMRGCVACEDIWPWPISSRSFGQNYSSGWILFIFGTNDHYH